MNCLKMRFHHLRRIADNLEHDEQQQPFPNIVKRGTILLSVTHFVFAQSPDFQLMENSASPRSFYAQLQSNMYVHVLRASESG